jgi:hypothetical protein
MTNVCLQNGNAGFDFPAPSGNGTCGRGLVSLGGKMEPFRFLRGGGMMRLRTMPATNSYPDGPIRSPLMVATFPLRTMRCTNSSYASLVDATLVATSSFFRTMPDANSSLDDLVCAPLVTAIFLLRLCDMLCKLLPFG